MRTDSNSESGTARGIVLTDDQFDPDWQSAAYQQFLRDDGPKFIRRFAEP
jgi:hypothetical protein